MAYCETCARHKALKVLKDAGAWEEIIVPTFQNVGTEEEDDDGTVIVPDGTKSVFTENLLRNILDPASWAILSAVKQGQGSWDSLSLLAPPIAPASALVSRSARYRTPRR